jgi:hypothetical protein
MRSGDHRRSLTMTQQPVHPPGQPAPTSGTYEQMNVFGSPTGVRVTVMHGHPLPAAPIGHGWSAVEGDADDC